ncbi:172_t:CDS:2 [Cetraspora pellucida]|uniref:172_t:CDS:1 n=1 Tax=Cetraspora pellucida TaxID=1433469 RepID=A0ACA9K270_9GLOM|nr:172_t:CDS:2 [Cetraspora pellucida]
MQRAHANYRHHEQEQQHKRKKDIQAAEACVPLCVLEMDNKFALSKEQYANWLYLIDKTNANNALAEFCENTSCDALRELLCAICSKLFLYEHLTTIDTREVYLPLLEIDKYFEESFMGIDFTYGHPYIDNSSYKILLDRDSFVKSNTSNSENSFNL